MKYEKGKHLEYFRSLIKSGAKLEMLCDAITDLALDDDTDALISDDSTIEAKLFDLSIYCMDPGYKDEQEENYQKILELLGVSELKE